jgi:hypothetical protein
MDAIALLKHIGRDSCDDYATRSTPPAIRRPVERRIQLARFESRYVDLNFGE